MPTNDITITESDHLDKFRKLDDDEKAKIYQIIDTYLEKSTSKGFA